MKPNSPENNLPQSKKPAQEKLETKAKIANLKNWEEYKKLRLLAVSGADAEMFGVTPKEVEKEKRKSEQEWQADLCKDNMFIVLFWSDTEAIGMVHVRKTRKEGVWSLGSVYIKPEFRGQGLGKKIYAAPLKEIQNRGGKKVEIGVNIVNTKSFDIAKSFGFENVMYTHSKGRYWDGMDLDLTKPEVIKKIDEVLNAR